MLFTELVRFMADDGIGIADMLLFTGPKVCALLSVEDAKERYCLAKGVPHVVAGPRKFPILGPWEPMGRQQILIEEFCPVLRAIEVMCRMRVRANVGVSGVVPSS
jgi:hypothetical protein